MKELNPFEDLPPSMGVDEIEKFLAAESLAYRQRLRTYTPKTRDNFRTNRWEDYISVRPFWASRQWNMRPPAAIHRAFSTGPEVAE